MKKYIIPAFIVFIAMGWSLSLSAQNDDLYYDPSAPNNASRVQSQPNYSNGSTNSSDETYQDNNGDLQYYDGAYSDDYYYSSRINRFHRPYSGFGYYDNAYVDPYNYDPYAYSAFSYRPSFNLFFGNPYRFSIWNSFYSPICSPFGYSSFGNPYAYSGFGFGNYGFYNSYNYYNSYGGYPYYGGYSNYDRYNSYGTVTHASNNGVYYGPRTSGGVRNPTETVGVRRNNTPRVDPARATGRMYSSPGGYNSNPNAPGNTAGGGFVSPRNTNGSANGVAPANRNVPRGSEFVPDRSARPAQMNDRAPRTYNSSPSSNYYGSPASGASRSYEPQRSSTPNNNSYTPSRTYSAPAPRQQSYSAPQRSAPSYSAPRGGGSSSGGGSSHSGGSSGGGSSHGGRH